MSIMRINTRWVERLGERHKGFYTLEAFYGGDWRPTPITSRKPRRLTGTEVVQLEKTIENRLDIGANVAQPVTLADLKLMGLE